MNKLSDLLLPDAAFPRDEHGGVRRGHATRQLDRTAKGSRYPDECDLVAAAQALLLFLALVRDADSVSRPPQQDLEMRRGKRLRQVVPRSSLQRFEARSHRRVT